MSQIELTEQDAQPVLLIRTRTSMEKLSQVIGENYGKIMGYLTELGQQPAGVPYTCYHNMDMRDLDVEMGFPVAKALPGKDDIQAGEVPAGQYVTMMYKGPYSGMEKPYNEIFAWMEVAAARLYRSGGAMHKREKIIRAYFHSWVAKDDTVLQDTFAPDAHYIESWGPAYRGLEAIEKWFHDWCGQNDVLAWDIKGFLHQGDTSVCEWHFKCKCGGNVDGFDGVSVIRFDGGKIVYLKEFQSKTPNYYPYESLDDGEGCP